MPTMRVFAIVMLFLMPGLAQAAASAWQTKDNVRARLIAARVGDTNYAAVQFELQPGWHTYWRHPGASGIAPEIDFRGSKNIKTEKLIFPAPSFFDDGVGGFYGYKHATGFVMPIEFKRAKRASLIKATAFIGVCREICVPLTFDLSLQIPPDALADNSDSVEAVTTLLQAQPAAPSQKLNATTLTYDGVRLQLVVVGDNLKAPQIMPVPGPHDVIGPPRTIAGDKAAFIFDIPAWAPLDAPLIGRKMEFIIRDGDHAVEQQLKITDHRLLPQESLSGERRQK